MAKQIRISRQTRTNWLIDTAVFLGALVTALSGIYFLFFTSGGYQGGRNELYGITLLFARTSWSDLHLWGGVITIAAVSVHIAIHWHWIKLMTRRYFNVIRSRSSRNSRGSKVNVVINLIIALSFIFAALTGIYFLFFTGGGYQGGQNPGWNPGLLISRSSWDLVHTWSGVIMISAAVVHFAIHWRWVVNVTGRFFLSLGQRARVTSQS